MIRKVVDFLGDDVHFRRRRRLLYLTLVVILGADFLVSREHAEFIWDALPGWGAFYGFISCVLIILVSKFLGHQGGLMRREDYYD